MSKDETFDLTYLTIDSLSEGVGSSQITPLISRLSNAELKICMISYEKSAPDPDLIDYFQSIGVQWRFRQFKASGLYGGIERLNRLRQDIPRSSLIHARSDIPAVSGIASREAPVLWDVRSLWADQKLMIQDNLLNKTLYHSYRKLEKIAASKSLGMSTLTHAVVPVLAERNGKLPTLQTVVPTAVNLDRFRLRGTMPTKYRALFSGTYNDYYDLVLSALFMRQLRNQIDVETHWARPFESAKTHIGVGEERIFPSTQYEMASLIPNYSFGVSICKMDAGPSLTAAMPTKIAEFLACGRPIVINAGLGDMDELITEFNAGVILDQNLGNLNEKVTKLIELISDPGTPTRCRALAEQYFSMDKGSEKYLSLYSKMLHSKNLH